MTRKVLYMAHPMAPTDRELAEIPYSTIGRGRGEYEPDIEHRISESRRVSFAVRANIQGALRWIKWLGASFPEMTFIAPWIAGVLAVQCHLTPEQSEAGLVDDCAVIERCDGIVIVGGRMDMEHHICRNDDLKVFWYSAKLVYDLTGLGIDPPSKLCNLSRGGSHANAFRWAGFEAERSLICLSRMGTG